MDENDTKNEALPIVMIVERRTQRQADLSSAEVMRILRRRAAKAATRASEASRRNPK